MMSGARPARAERDTIERVICVLPLFHIYALTVVLLRRSGRGDLISLHQRFDVEAVMRDIEVKRATAFPGVPTMWIAIASLPDLESRDLSSLVHCGSGGAPLPVEVARIFERKAKMKLKSGWGMTETCSPGTGHPAGGTGQAGLDRVDAAGHRDSMSCRWMIPSKSCRPARSAKSASRGRTSPRATGTGRRKPRRPLSATAS